MRFQPILLLLLLAITNICYAHSGVIINADTGWSNLPGLPTATQVGANSITQHNAPIWRFDIGYMHDLNHYIGVGASIGHGSYSKYEYHFTGQQDISIDSSSNDFDFISAIHIKRIDLLLYIGGVRHTVDYSGSVNGHSTKILPQSIFGINYHLTPHVGISLMYDHLYGTKLNQINPIPWQAPSLNVIMIGVRFNFFAKPNYPANAQGQF